MLSNKTMIIDLCLSICCIFWILSGSDAKSLSHNIAYDGPFNVFTKRHATNARRLTTNAQSIEDVEFYHGLASGDPTDEDLVIWTRVTPPFENKYGLIISNKTQGYETISVEWAISTSSDTIDFECDDSSKCGSTQTSMDIDYTVKVIVDSLDSNTWYHYQFKVGDTTSDIGRTRTIPSSDADIDSWIFAFGSCKQYPHGYFNTLGDVAEREEVDMMVWLGDYVYEFPDTDLVNGTAIGRPPFPNNYLYNLTHYRGRYLSHHLDEDLQAAHKQMPWLILWDDHEVVNDYWKDGAPSKYQDDGLFGVNFVQRKANAYQAFFEWTPTRSIDIDANGGLHRSLRIGNLFDLLLVDARSQRTPPAANTTYGATLSASTHYAYGYTQRNWMIDELKTSQSDGTKWRILGNNDVFGQSPPAEVYNGREFFGEDKMEGYNAERQIILDAIVDNDVNNIINLAGGPHTYIEQKVYSTGEPIEDDSDSYPIMTEFVCDAFAAPKLFEESNWMPYMDEYEEIWSWVSPYIRFGVDGYQIMHINKKRAKVEYWMNNNTKVPTTKSVLDKTVCVYDNKVEFEECVDTDTGTKDGEDWSEIVGYIFIAFIICGLFVCLCLIRYKRNKRRKRFNEPRDPQKLAMTRDQDDRDTKVAVEDDHE